MYLRWLTRTALALALTIVIQMFGLPQLITGSLVNAMLLVACLAAGPSCGVVIGLVTPLLAFSRGILAPPLAPMIPFIMLGNAAFVALFWWLGRKWRDYLGLIIAAAAKFAVLALAVRLLTKLPPPVAQAMQWPQLATALMGGAIALTAFRLLPQLKN